jgi:hypothetical protein
MQELVQDLFKDVGITFVGRNYAMGGTSSAVCAMYSFVVTFLENFCRITLNVFFAVLAGRRFVRKRNLWLGYGCSQLGFWDDGWERGF